VVTGYWASDYMDGRITFGAIRCAVPYSVSLAAELAEVIDTVATQKDADPAAGVEETRDTQRVACSLPLRRPGLTR
jgi:hypothetical protein